MLFTLGASLSETAYPALRWNLRPWQVELDVLTGESRTLFSHVMFDIGQSANPMIDIGQVEGAFVQGLGGQLLEGKGPWLHGAPGGRNAPNSERASWGVNTC